MTTLKLKTSVCQKIAKCELKNKPQNNLVIKKRPYEKERGKRK